MYQLNKDKLDTFIYAPFVTFNSVYLLFNANKCYPNLYY